MGALQVDDDRLIFAALGLVDGGGVGQIQHFKVAAVILGNSAIAEVNGQYAVGVIAGDGCDITDIAIADVLAVFYLHDLVSQTVYPLSVCNLRLFPVLRIELFPKPLVQRIHARLRLLAVWGQKRHIVNTVFGGFL